MLELDCLDEQISAYYDNELSEIEMLSFEAKLATSRGIKDYTDEKCYEFFKISNSMKIAKIRIKQNANKIFDNTEENRKQKISLFELYSVFLERFNKFFSGAFLNINRNNSQ